MDITMIFATILFMIVAVIFSPLGLGGGVLYVPIFHYILEWDFQEAVIGSLTLVLMVTIGSGLAHSKTGNANHDAVKMGRIFAAPSAIIGTLLSGFLISAIGDISIKIIAIAILLFVVNRTINKMNQEEKPGHEGPTQLSDVSQTYKLGSSFAGMTSGLLGIGGGAILVTLNRNILKMDANKSSGTSYLVASTIVPIALLSHILLTDSATGVVGNTGYIGIIAIPTIVCLSAYFGAKYAISNMPRKIVTQIFLAAISLGILRYAIDVISKF